MPASKPSILLICDDETVRHEFAVKLDFLGEAAMAADAAGWRQAAADMEVVEVVLLSGRESSSLRPVLDDVAPALFESAIVLLGEREIPAFAGEELRARLFAEPDAGSYFRDMLDVLHKARLCHEHIAAAADANITRGLAAVQGLIGVSPAIQRIREVVARLADTEVNVLITGESGTGKEVVARNLHRISGREGKPFVPVNCGAIPGELLESELFGHERGAFTGAVATTVGRFERAHGGTLFLDEIGDMPLNMQVKMLRVLEEGSFERVGGTRSIEADVRILTATHQNLEDMIGHGKFREDLYYRINVFPIEMPPLRRRVEDIPLLLNELIRNLEAAGRGTVRFNSAAISALCAYAWPGNVRELANLVERMAILHPHGIVGMEQLPNKICQSRKQAQSAPEATERKAESAAAESAPAMRPVSGMDLKQYLANLERDIIERALRDSDGVVKLAAERLNLRRTTLIEKMRRHGLSPKKKLCEPA